MRKPFNPESPAESFHQPGLEYWFKERRTLVDFRRGPLARYFDGFAAFLKANADARSVPVEGWRSQGMGWPGFGEADGFGRQILPGEAGADGFYYAAVTKQ